MISEKPSNLTMDETDWVIVRDILLNLIPKMQVLAFGSRVTGRAKPFSDLDLVVMTQKPLDIKLHGALLDAFSTSRLPFRVDIIDWASTDAPFRTQIQQSAVRIL